MKKGLSRWARKCTGLKLPNLLVSPFKFTLLKLHPIFSGIQNRFLDHYFGETGMKNEEVDKEEVDKQVNGKLLLKYANMLGREYDDDDVKPQGITS